MKTLFGIFCKAAGIAFIAGTLASNASFVAEDFAETKERQRGFIDYGPFNWQRTHVWKVVAFKAVFPTTLLLGVAQSWQRDKIDHVG